MLISISCDADFIYRDNVGLLVEPYTRTNISTIILTNDLTEEVLEEVFALTVL